MPQDQTVIVEIPGVGDVEFPASMSQTDIARAAAKLHRDAQAQTAAPAAPATPAAAPARTAAEARGEYGLNILMGILKGAGRSVVGLGRMMSPLVPGADPIPEGAEDALGLGASNPAQSFGTTAEQVGEFFLPGGAPKKAAVTIAEHLPMLRKAAPIVARAVTEAIPAGVITGAQGGNPAAGAAIGAAGGVVSHGLETGIPRVRAALGRSADKDVEAAFNPTRHRTKVKTDRIAPEVRKRGITGNIEDVRGLAKDQRAAVGEKIDQLYTIAHDTPVDLKSVKDAVLREEASTYNLVKQADGTSKKVVHNPRKLAQVEKVKAILDDYGDTMTTEQAVALRRTWDDVVSRAGGFDEKAGNQFGVTLDDASEAGVKRPIAGALRKELAKAHPDIAAVNREFKFWADLDDVTSATSSRRVGQKRNLTQKIVRGGAMAAGGASGGGVTGAIVAGEVAARAEALFSSPKWKLVSAQVKTMLADALASGNQARVSAALTRATAALNARPTISPSRGDEPVRTRGPE